MRRPHGPIDLEIRDFGQGRAEAGDLGVQTCGALLGKSSPASEPKLLRRKRALAVAGDAIGAPESALARVLG